MMNNNIRMIQTYITYFKLMAIWQFDIKCFGLRELELAFTEPL